MGCQGRHGSHGKSTLVERGQDSAKTWSKRKAEHAALKTPPPPSLDCPVTQPAMHISEDSGAEDSDTLPDLDDVSPDQVTPCRVSRPLHPCESSPKKFFRMASPRRMESKGRHFLDTFQQGLKHRRTKDYIGPSKLKDIDKCVKATPKICSETRLSQKRKDRISQEMQAGSIPVHKQDYEVFKFPPDTSGQSPEKKNSDSDNKLLRNKFSGVRFLQDLSTFPSAVDHRPFSDFVKMQTALLNDLLDDLSDPSHFSSCMELLEDFCYKRKPPSMLIDKLMNNGFFKAANEEMLVGTYHVVLQLWQRFPDLIQVDVQTVLVCGDVLQKHLQNSMSGSSGGQGWAGQRGDNNNANAAAAAAAAGRPSLQQCRLYFQLLVTGLQLSLGQCTLADQKSVHKSLAFACLLSEGSKTLMKQLTHWLEFCLVVMHREHVGLARVWMCQLQTLLGVAVLVSRDRQEAAKNLSPELKRTYKYLTDLGTKKRLLQSFSCPLLCFYVLRLVMEDQCESTIVSSQFPSTVQEIIHNYYVALPPQDHLTPPPSPSDNGQEGGAPGEARMYTVQSCEELAMLVYFITRSFIACKQRRLHCDLRQQVLKGPSLHVMTGEEKRHFLRSIHEFREHLQALCSEPSAATHTYLKLLECLSLTS